MELFLITSAPIYFYVPLAYSPPQSRRMHPPTMMPQPQELSRFLARSGYSDLDIAAAFTEASNGDGGGDRKISFDEFQVYCRSHTDCLRVFTDRFAEVTSSVALSNGARRGKTGAKMKSH